MSDGADTVELPVWIGGCEKWVTGLTRRTTCDDIIYALLQHESSQDIDVSCYCIFERWRAVERPLKGRTKILKVWKAWGDECRNVRLSVKQVETPFDTCSEVSKTRKSRKHYSTRDRDRRSREKTRGRSQGGGGIGDSGVVRKDYGPIDGYPATEDNYQKAHAFHELVQVVIEQEKKIQEQLLRIRDTDSQIDSYETKMHELRMKENGQNYVQEAYLKDKSDESSSGGEELFPAIKANDLEAYMHICENILEMENKIALEQSKVLDLSHQIQEQSLLECHMPQASRPPPPPSASCPDGSRSGPLASVPEDQLQEELERLRGEISRSKALSEAQIHQMKLVDMTLREMDSKITQKCDYINKIYYEFNIAENAAVPPSSHSEINFDVSTKDRHSSSTSGVSEVSEMEGSDRSTSRTRGEEGRSRERARELTNRDKSRERSISTSSARGGRSGSSSSVSRERLTNISRDTRQGSFSKSHQPTMCYNVPQGRTFVHNSRGPEKSHQQEEYYVTKTYYQNTYQNSYLNMNSKNVSDDSNSDTGLSSLHSDEAPQALETLV